ncbi:MAG TPA: phosphoribosylanthranilate isomerase, partial [Gemmatimonadaceae bacterium]|nr:phosphoribosylanthranilate isomerase [Gemmatimonadaceae bacterium]
VSRGGLVAEAPGVKFCGLTRAEDVAHAVALGADYVGVVFAPSPRRVSVEDAARLLDGVRVPVRRVGVFGDPGAAFVLDAARAAGLDVVQLHGCTSVADVEAVRTAFRGEVWSVVRIGPTGLGQEQRPLATAAHGVVLDTLSSRGLGGTGESFDWAGVADAVGEIRHRTRVIVAGGLRAENVGRAIRVLAPDVVDVSSGVESAPGVKDHGRMRAFVDAVRRADRG